MEPSQNKESVVNSTSERERSHVSVGNGVLSGSGGSISGHPATGSIGGGGGIGIGRPSGQKLPPMMPLAGSGIRPVHTTFHASGPAPPGNTGERMVSGYGAGRGVGGRPVPQQSIGRPVINDAFSYLDLVRRQFENHPVIYSQFLDIMKDFKTNMIGTLGVIERVSQLFRGFPELIKGFNTFLPPGYRIDVRENGDMEIKQPNQSFPTVVKMGQTYTAPTAANQSSSLLNNSGMSGGISSGSSGMNIGSSGMMANTSATGSVPCGSHQPAGGSHPTVNHPPVNSNPSGSVRHAPNISRPTIPSISSADSEMNKGQPKLPPPMNMPRPPQINLPSASMLQNVTPVRPPFSGNAQGPNKNNAKNAEFSNAISYVNKIKNRFVHEPEVYKGFLEILHTFSKDPVSLNEIFTQVAILFKNHTDLLEDFAHFLPDYPGKMKILMQNSEYRKTMQPKQPIVRQQVKRQVNASVVQSTPVPKKMKSSARIEQVIQQKQEFDEQEFFEKVKKHLNNRSVYSEFLKCINLYTNEIIGEKELVGLVYNFIGKATELMEWFKKFIGYKEPVGDNFEPLPKDNQNQSSLIDLSKCKKHGSYRVYPRNYERPKCSGKDSIAEETINEILVSCPQFNSEDNAFLASKKNQYEEILFKCEDERFEMDLLIEANAATIQVLEPLYKKLQTLSRDEAEQIRLGDDFGGTSSVVYIKAIKRIYADKSNEVIEHLKKNPLIAVPVVLRRLKQKDEEWRKSQREWNKIWREIHFKNHYKSLDHQGINFKTNDRKNLNFKTLINEIEAISLEKSKESREREGRERESRERESRDREIKTSDKTIDKTMDNSMDNSIKSIKSNKALKALKVENGHLNLEIKLDSILNDCFEIIEESSNSLIFNFTRKILSAKSVFYGNSNFYIYFRYLFLLYSRLNIFKQKQEEFILKPPNHQIISPVASFLDVYKPPTCKDLFFFFRLAEIPFEEYYSTLKKLIKDFVANRIDANQFEDQVRFMFGTESFILFTMDKLVQSLSRQIQILENDPKSEQLIALFDQENDSDKTSFRSDYSFRSAADSVIGDEKELLFKFENINNKFENFISISLIDKSNTQPEFHSVEEKWSLYVDNYMKQDLNDIIKDRPPLMLKKSKRSSFSNLVASFNLECKICVNTYKMFFVENSEDFMFRNVPIPHIKRSNSNFISLVNDHLNQSSISGLNISI
ncbi:Paired amphipathic helix domain-containing protein [Rozella allomycis CSF55]|uniref:Paired amphipathic helix domain-containing protein n=1 Tax=Rozella allomycis (strain CSF55) TaxID=988480 RepID=A0A075B4F4_ROZAC|nr:Paired amphipathic helix domain-containing protein [Rozella allomycis CSF55]|eukprot:EPZ36097.1 Paired amphipathic helix domain-containing protein [Rozella allomycis CSF55]